MARIMSVCVLMDKPETPRGRWEAAFDFASSLPWYFYMPHGWRMSKK
jgi:hypothetical protein